MCLGFERVSCESCRCVCLFCGECDCGCGCVEVISSWKFWLDNPGFRRRAIRARVWVVEVHENLSGLRELVREWVCKVSKARGGRVLRWSFEF